MALGCNPRDKLTRAVTFPFRGGAWVMRHVCWIVTFLDAAKRYFFLSYFYIYLYLKAFRQSFHFAEAIELIFMQIPHWNALWVNNPLLRDAIRNPSFSHSAAEFGAESSGAARLTFTYTYTWSCPWGPRLCGGQSYATSGGKPISLLFTTLKGRQYFYMVLLIRPICPMALNRRFSSRCLWVNAYQAKPTIKSCINHSCQ